MCCKVSPKTHISMHEDFVLFIPLFFYIFPDRESLPHFPAQPPPPGTHGIFWGYFLNLSFFSSIEIFSSWGLKILYMCICIYFLITCIYGNTNRKCSLQGFHLKSRCSSVILNNTIISFSSNGSLNLQFDKVPIPKVHC